MQKDLTNGNLFGKMMQFAVPYLIACFLQTFYGMADLFITGQFNGAAAVSAVAVGSQVMHMLTVVIVGLAMGTTVLISRSVGAGSQKEAAGYIGDPVRPAGSAAGGAQIPGHLLYRHSLHHCL